MITRLTLGGRQGNHARPASRRSPACKAASVPSHQAGSGWQSPAGRAAAKIDMKHGPSPLPLYRWGKDLPRDGLVQIRITRATDVHAASSATRDNLCGRRAIADLGNAVAAARSVWYSRKWRHRFGKVSAAESAGRDRVCRYVNWIARGVCNFAHHPFARTRDAST